MNRTKAKAVVFTLGVLFGMVVRANADQWDQRTIFTFSGPVEVPGQVLDGGTYVFKVADSSSDRDIVQVFSEDESHLYGTFMTVPDYHLQPSGKTIINFDERAAGDPEAGKSWFYRVDSYGHYFLYHSARAATLGKPTTQPVASMPDELVGKPARPVKSMSESSVTALKKTSLKVQKPTGEEVELTVSFTK